MIDEHPQYIMLAEQRGDGQSMFYAGARAMVDGDNALP
jgi:hypothetical protein